MGKVKLRPRLRDSAQRRAWRLVKEWAEEREAAALARQAHSERIKRGQAAARALGRVPGRPKGTGVSKLDAQRLSIEKMAAAGATIAEMARLAGVEWPTMQHWLRTRGVEHVRHPRGGRAHARARTARGVAVGRWQIEDDAVSAIREAALRKRGQA